MDFLENAATTEIETGQIAIFEIASNNKSYDIKISNNDLTIDLNEFIKYYKNLIEE